MNIGRERAIVTAKLLAGAAVLLAAAGAAAQGHQPYAGQERRAIKASSESEIADLLAGRGVGLAKAAELNAYPGPMHVLEHAAALELAPAQRAAIEAIHAKMAAAAQTLGRAIVSLLAHAQVAARPQADQAAGA